jgi:hypothetical protein
VVVVVPLACTHALAHAWHVWCMQSPPAGYRGVPLFCSGLGKGEALGRTAATAGTAARAASTDGVGGVQSEGLLGEKIVGGSQSTATTARHDAFKVNSSTARCMKEGTATRGAKWAGGRGAVEADRTMLAPLMRRAMRPLVHGTPGASRVAREGGHRPWAYTAGRDGSAKLAAGRPRRQRREAGGCAQPRAGGSQLRKGGGDRQQVSQVHKASDK